MSKINFVGRVEELQRIDRIVGLGDERHVVLVSGEGGIGKTSLLQELYRRYTDTKSGLVIVPNIFDFDERALHIAENLERRIARTIGGDFFKKYLKMLLDLHRIEASGQDFGDLTARRMEVRQVFEDCFNQLPLEKRLVLLFDTTDRIGNEEVWQRLKEIIHQSNRTVFVLAGRNAQDLSKELIPLLSENRVHLIELTSLDLDFSEEYYNQKEQSLNLTLPDELKQKILLLSAGRPILVDLALEWTAHNVPLGWLDDVSLEALKAMTADELKEACESFEVRLVQDVVKVNKPIDQLVLLMSRVYPINPAGLGQLLGHPEIEAEELLTRAKALSFVKVMPDQQISLHDEMRRLVNQYVWPKVDSGGERRYHDSERAVVYLATEIERIGDEIQQLGSGVRSELDSFMLLKTKEREIWALREQLLFHQVFLDPDRGKETFIALFDQATRELNLPVRRRLIELVSEFSDQLTPQQRYEIEIRHVIDAIYHQDYQEAADLAGTILRHGDLSPHQRVNILLQRANALARLGKADEAIQDFAGAVQVGSDALARQEVEAGAEEQLGSLVMQAKNGLGWAYRITGDLAQASHYYEEVLNALVQSNKLGDEYGRVLNNLSFIHSERDRRQAIDYGQAALEHWEWLKDPIWTAKAHCTLGIAYYRSDMGARALEHFNEALETFRRVPHREEIGLVLSWRGALFQDMGDVFLNEAEEDLEESLQLGSLNIEAMTLNRLGRVYMSRGDWDGAEAFMRKSLECAKGIPDYVYWLGSIARLAFIAAEQARDTRQALQELEDDFAAFLALGKHPEENSLGMTYIGLARLYMRLNDFEKTLDYLRNGIPLVTEYGTYARSDVISRLAHFEKDFDHIDPDFIRRLGTALAEFIRDKITEDRRYLRVLTIMNAWAKGIKAAL